MWAPFAAPHWGGMLEYHLMMNMAHMGHGMGVPGVCLPPSCCTTLIPNTPEGHTELNLRMDGGCAIRPVGTQQTQDEGQKRRRRRRGGRAVRERAEGVEKRMDPTDGRLRSWQGFMMKHAQGASFEEADRLWEVASKGCAPAYEEDNPPSLLEPRDTCSVGFEHHPNDEPQEVHTDVRSRRVRFDECRVFAPRCVEWDEWEGGGVRFVDAVSDDGSEAKSTEEVTPRGIVKAHSRATHSRAHPSTTP
eukprot:Hpha_TRINITY_DN13910_c0_g1::TRINITY_DN13910_c0_g1_i3::g.35481::m.35481